MSDIHTVHLARGRHRQVECSVSAASGSLVQASESHRVESGVALTDV
jgi:hypothetical protein